MDSERSTPSKDDKDSAEDTRRYGDPFRLRPEQRLMMRSIPFFVLPTCENTPKTGHIKSKVDTHNPSYVPRSNSATQVHVYSQKKDYGHIKARVNTGHQTSLGGDDVPRTSTPKRKGSADELQYSRVNNLRRDYSRRPRSAGPFHHQRSFQFPTTQFPPAVHKLPSSERKYKNVKSRIGSLDNIHHKPGGGPAGAKIKQGSTDSIASPVNSGKDRIPVKVARVTKSIGKVKSRIDQSDPNPAHQLRHSLEELTIPEGQKLNPRFQDKKRLPSLSPSLQKSRTFDSISQLLKEEEAANSSISSSPTQAQLPRSATFEFLTRIEPLDDTQSDSTLSKISHEAMSTVVAHNYVPCNGVSKRKLYFTDDSISTHKESISTTKTITTHNHVPVIQPELHSSPNGVQVQSAFTIDQEEVGALQSTELNETNGNSEDMDIYDIEVSNSASETTVVLKHLFAFSGKTVSSSDSSSNSTSMPIIEESESEEEEEEDYPRIELGPYTLAHPVPKLLVSDEDGSIVETISIGVNLCTIANSNDTHGTNTLDSDDVELITHL